MRFHGDNIVSGSLRCLESYWYNKGDGDNMLSFYVDADFLLG